MKTIKIILSMILIIQLITGVNSLSLNGQSVKIGESVYEFTTGSTGSESESSTDLSQRQRGSIRRFSINELYIYPQFENLPSEEAIYLKQVQEQMKKPETTIDKISQSLDKYNKFLESLHTRSAVVLYVGTGSPSSFIWQNTQKFGYMYQASGMEFRVSNSPLGINNKRTKTHLGGKHIGFKNIHPDTEIELGLYIASIEEGPYNPQYGSAQRLKSLEKLASTKVTIREGANVELTIIISDEGWFLEAAER